MAKGFDILEGMLRETVHDRCAWLQACVVCRFRESVGPDWQICGAVWQEVRQQSAEEWDWFAAELKAFDQAARRAA